VGAWAGRGVVGAELNWKCEFMRAFYQNNAVRPFVVLASEFFLFASHIPI